jgi:hypothetical protein
MNWLGKFAMRSMTSSQTTPFINTTILKGARLLAQVVRLELPCNLPPSANQLR